MFLATSELGGPGLGHPAIPRVPHRRAGGEVDLPGVLLRHHIRKPAGRHTAGALGRDHHAPQRAAGARHPGHRGERVTWYRTDLLLLLLPLLLLLLLLLQICDGFWSITSQSAHICPLDQITHLQLLKPIITCVIICNLICAPYVQALPHDAHPMGVMLAGRGLHSSTCQLILSRFRHRMHP